MAAIAGEIADALISAVESNQPAIVAAITSAEGGVVTFLDTQVNALKVTNIFEQALLGAIKPTVISGLNALEAKESGAVIYAWAIAQAKVWATELGG